MAALLLIRYFPRDIISMIIDYKDGFVMELRAVFRKHQNLIIKDDYNSLFWKITIPPTILIRQEGYYRVRSAPNVHLIDEKEESRP